MSYTPVESLDETWLGDIFKDLNQAQTVEGSVNGIETTLDLTNDDGRQRLEVSPYIVNENGVDRIIFTRVGQIIADPNDVKPERSVGHTYESHLDRTVRWKSEAVPEIKVQVDEAIRMAKIPESWHLISSDGVSNYYLDDNGRLFRHLVTTHGREMVGVIVDNVLSFIPQGASIPIKIPTKLIYKEVVVQGNEKRSDVGSTQYAFGGFGGIFKETQPKLLADVEKAIELLDGNSPLLLN